MATLTGEFLKLRSFTTATRELNKWISGTEAFTLLLSAMDSGLLNALCSPCTIQQIAAATGLDDGRINNILRALENHGLVKADGDVFTLAPNIKNMMEENAIQSLSSVIRAARVRLMTLQDIFGRSKEYTDLVAEDTLSMAEGIGIASISPVRRSIGASPVKPCPN